MMDESHDGQVAFDSHGEACYMGSTLQNKCRVMSDVYLNIHRAAQAAGVSPSALRLWESRGLVRPQKTPSRLLKKQMRTALLFSMRRVADARAGRRDGPRASSAIGPEAPLACTARAETDPGSSYGLGREVADANQVVRREGQRKHPINAGASISR